VGSGLLIGQAQRSNQTCDTYKGASGRPFFVVSGVSRTLIEAFGRGAPLWPAEDTEADRPAEDGVA
jgi:hypothetical protein